MVLDDTFKRSKEQFKEKEMKFVTVWYGFPTTADDVEHVFRLFIEIKKDLPDVEPKEVKVAPIGTWQTNFHPGYTCLTVKYPLEKFLEDRDAGKFQIL